MASEAVIHLRHSLDGYPMCWPMDRDGEFEGSYVDAEVTCEDCKVIVSEG